MLPIFHYSFHNHSTFGQLAWFSTSRLDLHYTITGVPVTGQWQYGTDLTLKWISIQDWLRSEWYTTMVNGKANHCHCAEWYNRPTEDTSKKKPSAPNFKPHGKNGTWSEELLFCFRYWENHCSNGPILNSSNKRTYFQMI